MTIRLCIIAAIILLNVLSASAAKTSPSGISRLGYAIQMGAFSDVKNAERFTETLQKKGIEAFYFRKDNGVYAVRFGDFSSKEKARVVAKKLVAERLIESFYIAPPNEVVFSKAKPATWQKPPGTEIRNPSTSSAKTVVPADKQPSKHVKNDRDMGAIAARTAERFVGIPYRWGGENVVDGMDCSGFVRAVYNLCGLSIPRTSRDQYKAGERVARDELKDGDLVFFGAADDKINHVGIYVGNGRFVHAPKRGEEIKVTSVDESYFDKRYIGARRYF